MTKTTNKRRTAASIVKKIRARLEEAQQRLEADELKATRSRERVGDYTSYSERRREGRKA